jgi:hypothetical protein
MIKKKCAVVFLVLVIAFLAIAPETFACHRRRSSFARSYVTRSYGRPYYGVASSRYVNPYYRTGYANSYYRSGYANSYYRSGYASPYYRRSSRTRTILTIAAPAAIGAGLGALFGGGKGAGVGALLGGGGGAAYHLLRHRNRY